MKHQWRGTQTVLRVDCGKEEKGEEEEDEERRERGGGGRGEREKKRRRGKTDSYKKDLKNNYTMYFFSNTVPPPPTPPFPTFPHLEVNKQFGVLSCDIMHLHHIWSVDQLLQLSHRESVQLAQFLL